MLLVLLLRPDPACGGLWSVPVTFQEGTVGKGSITWANQAQPVSKEQSYDVLSRSGTDPGSGKPIYAPGQDGKADLTIRAQVRDFSNGRWSSLLASKTGAGLEAGTLVMAGTSRSGDAGLISLELRFDPSLQLTAGDFNVKLVSLNGTSSLYEWSMITVGTVDQAPFDPVRIDDYTALDYNDVLSGSFYDNQGGLSGKTGSGGRLGTGRSVSQFLAGAAGNPVSGGLVQPGWYSIDDFNSYVYDAGESFENPRPGDGSIDDNQSLTGMSLGLAPDAPMTAVTFWFGYHDVAFDSDGDGFTMTETHIFERIAGLRLGDPVPANSVPEPTLIVLLAIAGTVTGGRRRR